MSRYEDQSISNAAKTAKGKSGDSFAYRFSAPGIVLLLHSSTTARHSSSTARHSPLEDSAPSFSFTPRADLFRRAFSQHRGEPCQCRALCRASLRPGRAPRAARNSILLHRLGRSRRRGFITLGGSSFRRRRRWTGKSSVLESVVGRDFLPRGSARTGVTWEMESNKVNAPNEVWDELIKKGRHYKNFKKHGFEYDYDILGDIFNSSTATGKLSHASTHEPPNSDEERAMEGDFLTKGIHINVSDDEKDDMKGLRQKRKEIFSSDERRRKEGKTSNKEMLEKIVSIWSDSMSQRTSTSRAREERYKGKTSQASQATSPISDPYSAKACMELLDSMQDVPTSAYFKLMEKFTSEHWRQMFIVMDAERMKQLIESLTD